MQNGASVHMTNAEGATALHWAVVRNSLNCIEALLRAGGNKHAKDSRGYQVRNSDRSPVEILVPDHSLCACTKSYPRVCASYARKSM